MMTSNNQAMPGGENVATSIIIAVVVFYVTTGWMILSITSAKLLLPDKGAAKDRLAYALDFKELSTTNDDVADIIRLKLRIVSHLLTTYLIILPTAAYLWLIDELLFGKYYKQTAITKPVITISVPRAGTTSFHRTLALDKEQFVTPVMLELVLPFLCVQNLLWKMHTLCPNLVNKLEEFLKSVNGVTSEVEARHPIGLFAPDADDILLGEWHWVSVGSIRTFPVSKYWKKHYLMSNPHTRRRSLELHKIMCQKILYSRGGGGPQHKRLLLRSHLSPCMDEFKQLYPDAIIVGIVRNPAEVLPSFAGLSNAAVEAATGLNMLGEDDQCRRRLAKHLLCGKERVITHPLLWSKCFVEILSDMMGNETKAANAGVDHSSKNYVLFQEFKSDPVKSIEALYEQAIGVTMTSTYKMAIQNQVSDHESYKQRHSYSNPTFNEMQIDEQQFLKIPTVQQYQELLMNISGKGIIEKRVVG